MGKKNSTSVSDLELFLPESVQDGRTSLSSLELHSPDYSAVQRGSKGLGQVYASQELGVDQ